MEKSEIKFRAWHKAKKIMIDGIEHTYDGLYFGQKDGDGRGTIDLHEIDYELCYTFGYFLNNPKVEVMQYTGLKDKNGVEIYEGDIVKSWGKETETMTGEKRMVVEDAFNCYAALRDSIVDEEPLEVIGNIYENPELLIKE